MARFVWYITKRVLNYVVMIFVATSLTYFLASSFMSPRSNYESRTPRPPQESIEASLDRANLNDKTPIMERYQKWLGGIFTKFDWGMTPQGGSVNQEVSGRIGASVKLMLFPTVLSIAIGVSLGVYTAQRQYHWQDRFWSGVASGVPGHTDRRPRDSRRVLRDRDQQRGRNAHLLRHGPAELHRRQRVP